jgi:hypothetical protein
MLGIIYVFHENDTLKIYVCNVLCLWGVSSISSSPSPKKTRSSWQLHSCVISEAGVELVMSL